MTTATVAPVETLGELVAATTATAGGTTRGDATAPELPVTKATERREDVAAVIAAVDKQRRLSD